MQLTSYWHQTLGLTHIALDEDLAAKKYTSTIPKSEHTAGDSGVIVVKMITTHCAPDTVKVHLQPSCLWNTGLTNKSSWCKQTQQKYYGVFSMHMFTAYRIIYVKKLPFKHASTMTMTSDVENSKN